MDSDFPLDIPVSLCLEHDGDAKYIIEGIYNISGNEATLIEYALVSIDFLYHSDIHDEYFSRLRLQNKSRVAKVLGGGIITVNKEKKRVKTYGRSGGYGPPPKDVLNYVADQAFPDFERDITITGYIRG